MMGFEIPILIFFMGASLLLYILLGGADYGAGILEFLPSGEHEARQKKIINYAMGPVWEANHMWLILIIVILFMGFPGAYFLIVTSLHIPIVALLIGIVVRGSVFTFRHYDAIQEPRSQKLYTRVFSVSSVWTSVWLGIIAASLFRGSMTTTEPDFWSAYIKPWWGLFPLSVGAFTALNFSYLASIYLIGETKDITMKRFFARRALLFNILVVACGACVFVVSHIYNESLFDQFFSNVISVVCMILATLCFAILWLLSKRDHPYMTRVVAGAQTSLILFGWYASHAPYMMITAQGPLRFDQLAAPSATLNLLCLSLLVGSVLIFPSLYFLMRVFKSLEQR